MFDLHYECSDDYVLLNAVHEISHFAWFEIWQKIFPNHNPELYEQPHLDWLISEIAIEPIFRFSMLHSLSPHHPAYDYFYEQKIDDKTIVKIANEIYQASSNINDFQIKIYNFFKAINYKKIINKL